MAAFARHLSAGKVELYRAGDAAFAAYRDGVASYIARLAERGVVVPDTVVEAVPRRDGTVTAYCVQPVLPARSLLPRRLQGAGDHGR